MKVIELEINDIEENEDTNIDKLNLANDIISNISPLFNKEYLNKLRKFKKLKSMVEEKKIRIQNEKLELETILNEFNKKEKQRRLIYKLSKLIYSGLIQETMKFELITILNSFDTLDDKKITEYLTETMRIISRKFAKI